MLPEPIAALSKPRQPAAAQAGAKAPTDDARTSRDAATDGSFHAGFGADPDTPRAAPTNTDAPAGTIVAVVEQRAAPVFRHRLDATAAQPGAAIAAGMKAGDGGDTSRPGAGMEEAKQTAQGVPQAGPHVAARQSGAAMPVPGAALPHDAQGIRPETAAPGSRAADAATGPDQLARTGTEAQAAARDRQINAGAEGAPTGTVTVRSAADGKTPRPEPTQPVPSGASATARSMSDTPSQLATPSAKSAPEAAAQAAASMVSNAAADRVAARGDLTAGYGPPQERSLSFARDAARHSSPDPGAASASQQPPAASVVAAQPQAKAAGLAAAPASQDLVALQGMAEQAATDMPATEPRGGEPARLDALRADPTRQVPAHTVTAQLAEAVRHGRNGAIEVSLNPEELGRVRLSLHGNEGSMHVLVQADRPETADLLRRHIALLQQDFRDLGYSDISFSFGDGNARDGGAAESAEQSAERASSDAFASLDPASASLPTAPAAHRTAPGAGLDLRL